MRVALLKQVLSLRPAGGASSVVRVASGAVAHHDPGPPCTYDDIPVPYKPWKSEYEAQQKQFNMILLGGIVVFSISAFLTVRSGIFPFDAMLPPPSYRNRVIHKD